jgi:hypothetical protein
MQVCGCIIDSLDQQTQRTKMKIEYKYTVVFRGVTHMYSSYDEAMKMAKFVGAKLSDIKELHIF